MFTHQLIIKLSQTSKELTANIGIIQRCQRELSSDIVETLINEREVINKEENQPLQTSTMYSLHAAKTSDAF